MASKGSQSSRSSQLPDQLILLIIRFTASIPDLSLPISTPRTITTLALKQLIREHLPREHAKARLRLIYAGKVLVDTATLATSLRLRPPLPPPPQDPGYNGDESGSKAKGKGKQPIRDTPSSPPIPKEIPSDAKRFYIHCSLGDALSPSELASEAAQAEASSSTFHEHQTPTSSDSAPTRRRSSTTTTTTTTPSPRGFDRLLASGFTPAEIATLRSQFLTNLSYTHTPDAMPTGTALRALEDRWLDSSVTDPAQGAAAAEGGALDTGWGAGFSAEEGGLDDMVYGYLTGFFWALPALIWGLREEGVWTRRRQVAVVMGVVLNAAFGFMGWNS